MVAVGSFLLVLALSLIVVRVGAVALMMTGLSEEVAQFQALSAFSGTGFTTTETEGVVSHPARRKTVALLIRFGSAGGVTAISTLMLSLIGAGKPPPSGCWSCCRACAYSYGWRAAAVSTISRPRWSNGCFPAIPPSNSTTMPIFCTCTRTTGSSRSISSRTAGWQASSWAN